MRNFLSKHHFFLTKLYCIRYSSPDKFEYYLKSLIEWLEARTRLYAFIKIAEPGEALCKKAYAIKEDVDKYNEIICKSIKEQGVILDPYNGHDAEKYTLEEDGHHLSPYGAKLVYDKVIEWLDIKFKI